MHKWQRQMHFSFLFFRPRWKPRKYNVKEKLHSCDWVYFPGTDRGSWAVTWLLCCILSHLPYYRNRQCEHDFVNQKWLITPMFFFLSHPAFVDLCYTTEVTPKMLAHFLPKRKNHFRHWLLFTIPLFHCPGNHKLLYAYSDDLLPLHGHLQALVIW